MPNLKYINEKFTEYSDPIKDLGIGYNAFENIKPGDIIICKKNNKIFILKKEYELAVVLSTKKQNNQLSITTIPFGIDYDIKYYNRLGESAIIARNTILTDKDIKHKKYSVDDTMYKGYYVWTENKNISLWKKYFRVLQDKEIKTRIISEDLYEKNKSEYMKAKLVDEQFTGVGSVPGMGNAMPASTAATTGAQQANSSALGSGDKWGNTLGGKPYTQAKPIKAKKKKVVKKKTRKLEEENINPYDKIGMSMAKKMGVKPPFKKKKSKKNQNAMVQTKFEHQIASFDEFTQGLNEVYTADLQNYPEPSEIIQQFRDLFDKKYGYIYHSLTDREIEKFLAQKHINNLPIERAVDYFADYVLSQGMADDVQE